MIYKDYVKREVLGCGVYKGYQFAIISHGTHPCAYVGIDKDHNLYGKFCDEINILCHGGITYAGRLIEPIGDNYTWFFGWDYGHYNDYCGWYPMVGGKKWTTKEIYEEVKNVIEQLERMY